MRRDMREIKQAEGQNQEETKTLSLSLDIDVIKTFNDDIKKD